MLQLCSVLRAHSSTVVGFRKRHTVLAAHVCGIVLGARHLDMMYEVFLVYMSGLVSVGWMLCSLVAVAHPRQDGGCGVPVKGASVGVDMA